MLFLFKNPSIYKKCMNAAQEYSYDPSDENEAAMKKEWEAAKELYMREKQEQIDKLWEECLGVAVS